MWFDNFNCIMENEGLFGVTYTVKVVGVGVGVEFNAPLDTV